MNDFGRVNGKGDEWITKTIDQDIKLEDNINMKMSRETKYPCISCERRAGYSNGVYMAPNKLALEF